MPPVRNIAIRAAEDALRNVGVREDGGNNKGKWVAIYLASVGITEPAPWCMAFLYYRFSSAAKTLGGTLPGYIPCTGWSPSWRVAAIAANRWRGSRSTFVPRIGDVALFHNGERIYHGEIIVSVPDENGNFDTVGGNTSDGSGVNADGDGVFRRTRTRASLGQRGGFVKVG